MYFAGFRGEAYLHFHFADRIGSPIKGSVLRMALDLCSLIVPNDAHVNVLKEDPCSGKCYAQQRWPFERSQNTVLLASTQAVYNAPHSTVRERQIHTQSVMGPTSEQQ